MDAPNPTPAERAKRADLVRLHGAAGEVFWEAWHRRRHARAETEAAFAGLDRATIGAFVLYLAAGGSLSLCDWLAGRRGETPPP
jgi:hypothetical protein